MVRRLAALLSVLWPLGLGATSIRPLDVSALSRNADLIVVGIAESAASSWDGGRIRTRTAVRLTEVWAGAAEVGSTLEVTTLGGVVGDIGQRVSGAAELGVGRELVLFLRRASGRVVPVELGQGVFYVSRGADGVAKVARSADADGAGRIVLPSTLAALRDATLESRRAR